ncbi:DUF6255 family natural product biosynthesis protein [Streptomyces sp. NPDC053048]|uniref:DUF6255 family natural product biosynthesis protein n=1 Tax=Streptomyces sp. NPDC053048 TaxID=3365694 RepID=UPI0037D04AA3
MSGVQAALSALPMVMVLHRAGCALGTRPVLAAAPTPSYPPPRAERQPPRRRLPLARSEGPGLEGGARTCSHPESDWPASGGIRTCPHCGTRRVSDYRALGLALEPPERPDPDGPTVVGTGAMGADARRAELLRKLREANRWSARGTP